MNKTRKLFALLLAIVLLVGCLPVAAAADNTGESATSGLTAEQLNSMVMLNYLTFLTQEINSSSNSRLYLEEVYSDLINNTNSKAIDSDTQYYLNNLLDVLESYRMIDVKRERLEYIYEQNKAQALREAVPNPLGLLSAVQSFSMRKIVASVVYMAVDSIMSYQSASSQADLEYLKDGWELDDAAAAKLHNSRLQLFNYMLDVSRNYDLPDELTLRETDIEELVKYENNKNVVSRIQFLEAARDTFQGFSGYWLILAKSYYEKEDYAKCLEAVKEYEKLNIEVFRKDQRFAEVLPLAICSLEETSPEKEYIEDAPRYALLIEKNTSSSDWALRYFAAQTYVSLYAKTNDTEYLKRAYDIALNNVNYLVETQRALNATYLADVVEAQAPDGATRQEKKEIKQYNKMLKESRKLELPPTYEPLLLNCDLLFALAGQLSISSTEKTKINEILHPNGSQLFLVKPLDDTYRFESSKPDPFQNISFDGSTLIVPVQYLSTNYGIRVSVFDGDSTVYEDWELKKIERKSGASIETFTATFTSETIKKHKYTADSVVRIEIIPLTNSECQTVTVTFKVNTYRNYVVFSNISFGRVE